MGSAKSASWVVTGVWMALLTVAAVGVTGVLILHIPNQKRLFDEFGMQLPWLSKSVLNLSTYFTQYWWFLLPVMLAVVCGGTILGRHLPRRPTLGTVFAAVSLTALAVSLVVIQYSMMLPYQKLHEGLSK